MSTFREVPKQLNSTVSANLKIIPAQANTISNSDIVQGVHIARSNALICLKASAYLDLQKRQAQGEKVDLDDISKHRNDIIRLGLTLTAEQSFPVPEGIKVELYKFFDAIQNNLPQDDFIERAGARGIKVTDVIDRIKEAFNV